MSSAELLLIFVLLRDASGFGGIASHSRTMETLLQLQTRVLGTAGVVGWVAWVVRQVEGRHGS